MGGPKLGILQALSSLMAQSLTGYERLKRYREKRSLEREDLYLSKRWPEGYKSFTARQWASRKRWFIFYTRRKEERESGLRFPPKSLPSHWPGEVREKHGRYSRAGSRTRIMFVSSYENAGYC